MQANHSRYQNRKAAEVLLNIIKRTRKKTSSHELELRIRTALTRLTTIHELNSHWQPPLPNAPRLGAKVSECAIAAGRWVGRQTRCLVSVLTKRGINSMKTGQFILDSQINAQRVPPRSLVELMTFQTID